MKTVKQNIVYLFLALSFLLSGQAAYAFGWSSEYECEFIQDADSKQLCLALTRSQTGYFDDCKKIGNADTQNFCYGLTKERPTSIWDKKTNDCDKIIDHGMKAMCHFMGNQKKK